MANPNSRSNALNIFRQRLKSISSKDHVLFILGEVDCGFLIWYRAAKYGLPVETQVEESLGHYQDFISSVIDLGYDNLIVCSVPLPTIFDDAPRGEIAHARREVSVSLEERTDLTRRYNAGLREFCNQVGPSFLDFEADLLDESTGIVRRELLNADPLDHHLAPAAIAPLLAEKLRQLSFS